MGLFDVGYSMPSGLAMPTDQGSFWDGLTDRVLRAADYWIEGEFGPRPVAQPTYLADPWTYSARAVQPANVSLDAAASTSGNNTLLYVAIGAAAVAALLVLK